MGLSQNASGWTIATHTKTGAYASRIIYVSESGNDGTALTYVQDDANWDDDIGTDDDPFNPTGTVMPYLTIAAAMGQIRDGYPDWVLLKKGDTWTDETFGDITESGYSETERLIFGAYGTGARPMVQTAAQAYALRTPTNMTAHCDNFAVIGIEFYSYTRDPDNVSFSGVSDAECLVIYGPCVNTLIEDCKLSCYQNGLTVQAGLGGGDNMETRRCVICDMYGDVNPRTGGNGIYYFGFDRILLEECVFDQIGFYGDRTNGGIYIAVPFTGGSYVDSTRTLTKTAAFADYAWASGDLIYLLSTTGNVADGHYEIASRTDNDSIVLAANAGLTGDSSADVESRDSQAKYGHSVYGSHACPLPSDNTQDNRDVIVLRDNIFLRVAANAALRSGGTFDGNLCCDQTYIDFGYTTTTYWPTGIYFDCKNNVSLSHGRANQSGESIYNYTRGTRSTNTKLGLFTANYILHEGSDTWLAGQYGFGASGVSGRDGDITFNGNVYWNYQKGTPFTSAAEYLTIAEINNIWYDLASTAWSLTGTNRNAEDLSLYDTDRTVETYQTYVGGTATLAAFATAARLQSRDNWDSRYETSVVRDWIAAGYQELSEIGGAAPTIVAALL